MRTVLVAAAMLLCLAVPASTQKMASGHVTVAATATLIYTAPASGTGRVTIKNTATAVSMYLGNAGVTTSNGFEIAAGDSYSVNLSYGDAIYGIVATSTQVAEWITGAFPQ